MKRIFLQLKQLLRNERGEITFFACFFVVGIVMLISFLLLYASIRITCINIRNGAKMELNNLSGTIYADTYRSQRETNFEEYLNTLYSSSDYTDMLEATVAGGLDSKIPLSTEDYKVSDISLEFNVEDGRVEYIFYCDVEFYCHIMTPLRFIVDWNSLLPIHPPVISGIIVCGLDFKDRCGTIWQFHKVVHISQHPRILWVLEHLFDLVDRISGFPLEYLCYQRLQQMPHFHGNPVALIIFH